jgi:methionine aminopeptidase
VVLESSENQGQIITRIIDVVNNAMSPAVRDLGENVYVSEIRRDIQNVAGVVSLTSIDVYNKVGGQYSSSETSQSYSNSSTRQIQLVDDTIFAEPSQVYQVRFPEKDIKVRVKNLKTVSFS